MTNQQRSVDGREDEVMAAKEFSGVGWVARFPDAKGPSALVDGFREGCKTFIAAMTAGGVHVTVNSTRRPKERAYLMHYSWRIHKRTLNPQNVPAKTGVDIDWSTRLPAERSTWPRRGALLRPWWRHMA